MSAPHTMQGYIRMPDAEFQELLARAATEGARHALANTGLDGAEVAVDIRDLRSRLDCIRFVRRGEVLDVSVSKKPDRKPPP